MQYNAWRLAEVFYILFTENKRHPPRHFANTKVEDAN